MSVCDPDNSMHSLWKGYLPENLFAPAPQSRMGGEWDELDMVPFARLMAAHRHEIAAVIPSLSFRVQVACACTIPSG